MKLASRASHLGQRLSGWLAWLSLLGLGTVSVIVYGLFDANLSARQQQLLERKQQVLLHWFADASSAPVNTTLTHMLTDFMAADASYTMRLTAADGRTLFDNTLPQAQAGRVLQRVFELPITPPGSSTASHAKATLVMDLRSDDALLRTLAWILAASMLAGAVILSLLGGLLVRLSLRPMQSLVEQINDLSAKQLERRLDGQGLPQELMPLVTQFNALLDRLSEAYRQLESFNAEVAHEMNTPLATLISSTEVVLRQPRSAHTLEETLGLHLEELRQLASIVKDMLFLSRADQGIGTRATGIYSLAAIAQEVASFYDAVALEADVTLQVHGDALAPCDAALMRRAIFNLLSNATRYAQAGTCISIHIAAPAQEQAVISVTNRGPEIAPEHLAHIFERFYRADNSAATPQNHGLGLAIVQAIAKLHGGSVFVQSAQGQTCFGIILPCPAQAHQAPTGNRNTGQEPVPA
ncbi:heavy metal sensor histidine kinase [Lampropedia aestuarii]|uniref:Sensor protein n=1 Tax=Lampropedia aestuarii TaxID=2562762 RepID=A0A4S5BTZ6_9BURK|nr:heavy metal sensor histidine kinase [Lampropedia aestuarii]THJ36404.1 heavy metal sensor histidine kinase [Lampropedia aestuarii]